MSKNLKTALTIILTLLFSAAIVVGVLLYVRKIYLERETDSALTEETVTLDDSKLLGTYDVRFEYPDSISRFVGVFEKDVADNYVLTILSEYAPKVLLFEMQADGSLYSSDLGKGIVVYKESIDKVTIRFKKEDYRCTLTK